MTHPNEAFIQALQDRIDANKQRSDPYDVTACIENAGLAYAISLAKTMLVDEGLWRDISTAPKDGAEILGYDPIGDIIMAMWWKNERWESSWDGEENPDFTHWRLLPAAPGEPASSVDEGGTEQQLREALKSAIRSVECASIDVKTGEELPWYRAARAALALPAGQRDEGVVDEDEITDLISDALSNAMDYDATYHSQAKAAMLAIRPYLRTQPIKADLEKCAREE